MVKKITLEIMFYLLKCFPTLIAYHHSSCEFKTSNLIHGEVYAIQHFVIKFVSDL